MENPFTLSFGKRPVEAIERPVQFNEILDTFTSETPGQQMYIITGVRGSGKTVLATSVSGRLRQDESWIIVELNPETDLLKGLASKLSSNNLCSEIFRSAKINLSFLGLGLEISGTNPITDTETAVSRMLESLKARSKRVLVIIDEVTNNENMRVFSAAFQIFIRQELPVFMLMTGLYENVDDLQNEKSLTFLYRAPKIQLGPLNKSAVASRYRSLFNLDQSSAKEMAELTKGYPFAFQVLGYLTWKDGGDYKTVQYLYRQYLEEYVYDKIWSELSSKDKRILYGVAMSKTGKVSDISEFLSLKAGEINPYRKRLIRKGLVNGEERGLLKLNLPLFDEYVKDNFQ